MKKPLQWLAVLLLAALPGLAAPPGTTEFIRIDQFGYLQNARKVAVVVSPQVGSNAGTPFNASTGPNQYQVRRWSDDAVVFTGTLQTWREGVTQTQSGDKGWWFDFSVVNTPGSYYVFDVGNNVGSYRFDIGDGVYNEVLKAAVRTFFYQRINFAKQPPYADPKWTDAATHEGPGQDRQATSRYAKGDVSTARDLHGGWMDAGDMNKYVTFAEEPVVLLLESYRLNPSVFGDNFNLPESGNGVPDVLDEAKWELDFLRRMQDATGTGGLFLKVGVDNYNETNPPSADRRPRYYLPECTSSTLAGAAMFAAAGATFRSIPALNAYAQDLIARAEQAFARARETTVGFTTFQSNCDDGDIKSGDADKPADVQRQSAVVAAIYLFEATGKAEYKSFVEAQYGQIQPIANEWWGPYSMHVHIALLRYAANPAATAGVAARIRNLKSVQNGVLSITDYNARTDLYRAHMPDAQYHWGSSQVRANAGAANLDFAAFNVNPANRALYQEVAGEYLHWFHGVNAQGKVMLSNMYAHGAENSQNEIYHVWYADGTAWDNALTSSKGPVPGFNTGGPNNMDQYNGTLGYLRNEPLQKRYKDWNTGFPENSWIFTEVAIYNQAAYINLLSRLMMPTSDPTDTEAPTAPTNLTASDLSPYSVKLSWTGSVDNRAVTAYEIYQGDAKIAETPQTFLNLTTLSPNSSYVFTVKAVDFSANRSAPSNAVTVNTPAPSPNDYILYGDALRNTLSDWSWNSTNNPANADPVKLGAKSLKVNVTTAWGGLSLRNSEVLNTAHYPGGVQFWFYGGDKRVRVMMSQVDVGPTTDFYTIVAEPNTWTLVRIPWSEWGNPAQIQRISFTDGSGGPQSFILDDLRLVAGETVPDTQAPSVPTNLTTSNVTSTGLRLTWTASTDNVGVTAYEVYQNGTLLNGSVSGTSLDVTGLTCNAGYGFSVKAKDAAGNTSAASSVLNATTAACADAQAPTVPTNVVASSVTASGLTLTWAASTDDVGVTAYEVLQNGTLINGNATGTSLAVGNLTCGTAYSFKVLAKDAAGNKSAPSEAATATTLACPPTGSEIIYDEALSGDWQEWGWSVQSNYGATNPVKMGQKSLAVNYTDGWGGWAITRNAHFVTTPTTTLRFWIFATTNKPIGVCTNAENDSQQSPYVSFQPTPNVWQEVVVTMPQLANPARIKRLTIQSQASGTNLIYLDNVRLEPSFSVSVSNVTTTGLRLTWAAPTEAGAVAAYEVFQNETLLNGNVTGTNFDVTGLDCGTAYRFAVRAKDAAGRILVNSLPVNVSTTFCPGSSTVEMIYDEAFNPGWQEWSWSLKTNYANLNPVKVGQKSASLAYDGWGGWSIHRSTHLIPNAQTTLRFWLFATTNKTLAVTTYAEDGSQASRTVSFQPVPNAWQEVVITMAQLGNPARIKRLVVQSAASGVNQVYLDHVRFETPNGVARLAAPSAEIPAEGRLTVSPNPTSGPVRVQVLYAEAATATLSVLTHAGVPVQSQSVPAEVGENEYALDLSRLAPGLYLVRWEAGNERVVRKVLLVK
jgi:chitodextrinase